jgi:Transposase DDE domain group 1
LAAHRIAWRGDSHYGRVEAMEWAEDNGADYIFGLAGNTTLDALVAETADNLRFHHARSSQTKLRTYASFMYQAGSWTRPRKVVARLECSLQPDAGETTSTGMRQEVDIRYVVTSLRGTAQHLYEDIYCQRGQMENLIKLHKAQLFSDRMSCHNATANQVRLARRAFVRARPRRRQSSSAGTQRTTSHSPWRAAGRDRSRWR